MTIHKPQKRRIDIANEEMQRQKENEKYNTQYSLVVRTKSRLEELRMIADTLHSTNASATKISYVLELIEINKKILEKLGGSRYC